MVSDRFDYTITLNRGGGVLAALRPIYEREAVATMRFEGSASLSLRAAHKEPRIRVPLARRVGLEDHENTALRAARARSASMV